MCAKTRQIGESCSKTELLEIRQCEGKISIQMSSDSMGHEGEQLHGTCFTESEKIPDWMKSPLPTYC